jgi:hypothetical protein
MQNNITYDIRRMLMWHNIIGCWYKYLTHQENNLVDHKNIGI